MKVLNGADQPIISVDHPNQTAGHLLLAEALGTVDRDFVVRLLKQLSSVNQRDGKLDEEALNYLLSLVKGIKPRDQVEAMLAAQMAVVHDAVMTFALRLGHVDNLPYLDSAERAFNKLARTFATQMEALKRYRTGGEQKVTVQHVSVSEGGQAIVGNVTQAAARETAPGQAVNSPPALAYAQERPMSIIGETESAPVASEHCGKVSLTRARKADGRSPG